MSFLVPAFLAGLAALAIPVLVHLTRRRKTEVRPFPSLLFLHKVPHQVEERRRIQHWALLALRALAVALLVAAFARPFFEKDAGTLAAAGGPVERVVLLDRSYSMAAGDRWSRAVSAARDAAASSGPLDRTTLVVFGQAASAPVRSSGDPAQVSAVLDTLQPGWEMTRYGPALKLAQSILDESELPARELVLVSDFQRNGWSVADQGVALPAGTRVRTVPVGGTPVANAGVATVQLAREVVAGRERITPTVRLVRTGGEGPEERKVMLDVEGREIQSRTVTLPADGSATVTFPPFTLTEPNTRGTVRLEPDLLPRDDARHFVVSPGRALGVRILTRAGAPRETTLYLQRALGVSEDGAFDPSVRTYSAAATSDLDGTAVVVLDDVPFPQGAAGDRLRSFVEGGGGLVVVAGEAAGWPQADDSLFPGRLAGTADRLRGGSGRLAQLQYDHPIFQPFQGPRGGDFSAARFFRQRVLEGATAQEVLARFDDGTPALAERRVGDGRVLVWTSTLDGLWNDFPLQPLFLPFVHELVRHASGRREALPWLTTGQVVDVSDARAMATAGLADAEQARQLGAGERVVLTPSGGTERLPAGAGPHYLTLDESGFYQIRPPGETPERPLTVAVNVDLSESDLTTLDPAEMAASLVAAPGDGSGTAPPGSSRATELVRQDQERRQSLWRFLLAGAAALLVLETVLSNRVSRRAQQA